MAENVNAVKTEKAIQEARVSEEGSQQVSPDGAQVDESDNSSSNKLFKNGLSPIHGASPKPFESELVEAKPSFKREEISKKSNVSPIITPKMT